MHKPKAPSPIDHRHLDSYTDGDRALEDELLGLFVTNGANYLAALHVDADAASWAAAAHALKGSALSIGATTLAMLAAAAEEVPADPQSRQAARQSLLAAFAEVADYAAQRRVK